METHKINENQELVIYEINGQGYANIITRDKGELQHVSGAVVFTPKMSATLPHLDNNGKYDIVFKQGQAQWAEAWAVKPSGEMPAAWIKPSSNSVETTENTPIVDIMAITRGMCK